MTEIATVYRDLDYSFTKDENGELLVLTNEESIKQSIITIIKTMIGEKSRYQLSIFGSKINTLLGEKIGNITTFIVADEIEIALKNWEKRIDIIDITTSTDIINQFYKIDIKYNIKSMNLINELSFTLDILK